jgi:hypothetical protein
VTLILNRFCNAVNAVIESTELAPGSDLRAGWLADDIGPTCRFFFATRSGIRVRVAVESAAPASPLVR